MNNNLKWLFDLFAQKQFSDWRLEESYSVKWFGLKKGRALYNIKQIAIANSLEFKMHALECLWRIVPKEEPREL